MKLLHKVGLCCTTAVLLFASCKKNEKDKNMSDKQDSSKFEYVSESFADLQILRFNIPGFETLTSQQKELAYYLYMAGLSGRDMIWDQSYKYNLVIRKVLEAIIESKPTESEDYQKFLVYAKRVFFSNGIHHHYGQEKIIPECTQSYFESLIKGLKPESLPLQGKTIDEFIKFIMPILYDPKIAAKRVNLDPKHDMVVSSAGHFYDGVTQKEVEDFYKKIVDKKDKTPISYGLNSQLVKKDGKITENVWKVGGMYSESIEKVVFWLEKAVTVAENEQQKKSLSLLIEYYKTGDLKKFDEYNIAWVQDTSSVIDVVNGFIEVYGDPLGYRGSYESVVSMKDMEATKRIAAISKQAQWFEDNSPLMAEHKKKSVTGISAKVITVIGESGDAAPHTPIGINLPNSEWIRKDHGSKSVNLGNIVYAYNMASSGGGMLEEFAFNAEEIELSKKYGALAGDLHTDMHEVIGHASGQLNPGVGQTSETLKNYASTLEEARADLVALYYIIDPKLVEIGVMPTTEVGKAEYNSYIRNGMMTQLIRLKLGANIEEAHMRNRQLVASWAFEKGQKDKVIEQVKKDGKTYFVVRDYDKLRKIFGDLLREIQRIKSEGDYKAGKDLVENYGVKVNQEIHKEVLERYQKLKVAPYNGFINPKLVPVMNGDKITDVKVEYPTRFVEQMLEYGKEFSTLPAKW